MCLLYYFSIVLIASCFQIYCQELSSSITTESPKTKVSAKDFTEQNIEAFKTQTNAKLRKLWQIISKIHPNYQRENNLDSSLTELVFNLQTLSVDIKQLVHANRFIERRFQKSIRKKFKDLELRLTLNRNRNINERISHVVEGVRRLRESLTRQGIELPPLSTTMTPPQALTQRGQSSTQIGIILFTLYIFTIFCIFAG